MPAWLQTNNEAVTDSIRPFAAGVVQAVGFVVGKLPVRPLKQSVQLAKGPVGGDALALKTRGS